MIYALDRDNKSLVGLNAKMQAQRRAFQKFGDVDLINVGRGGVYINDELVEPFKTGTVNYWIGYYHTFFKVLSKLVSPGSYEFIYIRYPLALPSFIMFLKKWKSAENSRVYVEFPTYPYRKESFTWKRWILLVIDRLLFNKLVPYVDKFITHYLIHDRPDLPGYFMGNGVAIQDNIDWEPPNQEIQMIGVGNIAAYHAYDRVIKGLALYYAGKPEKMVYFNIVGNGEALESLKDLTEVHGLNEYVIFHGIKTGDSLTQLLERSHLGISTLGWHRLGVSSDGSLKSREYCMRGLPFITCTDDPDMPAGFPGKFTVGASDEPVNMNSIIRFIEEQNSKITAHMHEYACLHLTWDRKIETFIRHEFPDK